MIGRSHATLATRTAAAVLGLAAATSCFVVPAEVRTFPTDDAKLYELAKKEGTVVWYGSAPLAPMRLMAGEFEKKYPGLKVEVLRIVGVQQYQRFMQETQARQYIADVLLLSDQPSMVAIIDDGHVAEWKVPTHERFPEQFRMKNHAYATYLTDNAIIYNVKKVTPQEVKILSDWKGVLDPRFKKRFAVTTMKCGACYAGIHMFLDPKLKSEYGIEFLQKVAAQKPAIYSEVLVALDRVIAGEHDFTYWTWEGIGWTKWQQGAPVRWIHPKPTPLYSNSWQFISKYAPHPHAGRLFQNWVTSEEGTRVLQQIYGAPTVMSGVPDTRPVTKEPWYSPIVEPYTPDMVRWDRDYNRDMDLWARILQRAK